MPLQIEVKLGNEEDFQNYIKPLGGHDRNTLTTYWKRAARMKDRAGGGASHLLLIRRANMWSGQIFIIPFSYLPKITQGTIPPRYQIGWVGCKVPPATYLVFGSMVQSNAESEKSKGEENVRPKRPLPKTPRKGNLGK